MISSVQGLADKIQGLHGGKKYKDYSRRKHNSLICKDFFEACASHGPRYI